VLSLARSGEFLFSGAENGMVVKWNVRVFISDLYCVIDCIFRHREELVPLEAATMENCNTLP
jgi:hypothetical protein